MELTLPSNKSSRSGRFCRSLLPKFAVFCGTWLRVSVCAARTLDPTAQNVGHSIAAVGALTSGLCGPRREERCLKPAVPKRCTRAGLAEGNARRPADAGADAAPAAGGRAGPRCAAACALLCKMRCFSHVEATVAYARLLQTLGVQCLALGESERVGVTNTAFPAGPGKRPFRETGCIYLTPMWVAVGVTRPGL